MCGALLLLGQKPGAKSGYLWMGVEIGITHASSCLLRFWIIHFEKHKPRPFV